MPRHILDIRPLYSLNGSEEDNTLKWEKYGADEVLVVSQFNKEGMGL